MHKYQLLENTILYLSGVSSFFSASDNAVRVFLLSTERIKEQCQHHIIFLEQSQDTEAQLMKACEVV